MTPQPGTAPVVASATPAAAPVTPAAAAATPAGPTAAEFAALKAESEANKAAAAEHQRTAEFWHGKATAKPAAPAKAEPAEPEVDLLDLITTGGPKALMAHMRKQGLITRDEVDATVNAKVAQVTKETELLSQYPDLGKRDSEFFKATAANYGALKAAGVPEALAMELGAQQAELAGIKSGTVKTAAQKTEEQKATEAADRAARAAAGGGDHGNRNAAGEGADEDLTPEQRTIAIRMLGGNGVTNEQAVEKYKARAKLGTTFHRK